MGNESVRFEGEITWPEYRHVRRRLLPWWGRPAFIWTIALPVLMFWNIDIDAARNDPGEFVFQLLPMGLLLLIAAWAIKAVERWQWKSHIKLQGRTSGEVGTAGLRLKNEFVTAELPWTKITGYKIDDQLVLLYYAPLCAYFLPRSFVADETSWKALQAVVKRHANATTAR